MSAWRPTTREPDALHAGIYDYLRAHLPAAFLDSVPERHPLVRNTVKLSNGDKLSLQLDLTRIDVPTAGDRPLLLFDFTGHAADSDAGYEVSGRLVIDSATLALLNVDAELNVLNRRR